MADIVKTLMFVKIGLHKTHQPYFEALRDRRVVLCDRAKNFFRKTRLSTVEIELELVEVSMADLGLTEVTHVDDVCRRAADFFLYSCPAEAVLAACLAHEDRPEDEWLAMVTETIPGLVQCLRVFRTDRDDDEPWPGCDTSETADLIAPWERLVFVRRN